MSDETPSVAEARPCRNAALGKASREVSYGRCRHDLFVRTAFDPTSENAAPRQSRSPSEACALGEGSLRPASPKGSLSPIASAKSSSAQAGTLPKRQREQTARPRTAPPRHATKTRQRNAKECQGQGRSQESLQSLLQASPFSAPLKSQPFPVFSASTRPRFSMRSDALGHRPKRGCARAIARRFVQNACRQVRFRGRDRRFRVRYRHTSIREGCPRIEPRFACPHRTLRALRGRTIRRSHP